MTITRYVICKTPLNWHDRHAYDHATPLTGVRHRTIKAAAAAMDRMQAQSMRDAGMKRGLRLCASDALGDFRPLCDAEQAVYDGIC